MRFSGATACVVIHNIRKHCIHAAWVGNCRCVACITEEEREEETSKKPKEGGSPSAAQPAGKKKKKRLGTRTLTTDHLPASTVELKRIIEAGGETRLKDDGTAEVQEGENHTDTAIFPQSYSRL